MFFKSLRAYSAAGKRVECRLRFTADLSIVAPDIRLIKNPSSTVGSRNRVLKIDFLRVFCEIIY